MKLRRDLWNGGLVCVILFKNCLHNAKRERFTERERSKSRERKKEQI